MARLQDEAAAPVGRDHLVGLLDQQPLSSTWPPARVAAAKDSDKSINGAARMLATTRS
jgi:hypothetical protein